MKSAVLNYLNKLKNRGEEYSQADVAASFQRAVTDVLVNNAETAIKNFSVDKFAIAGGVASNKTLSEAMELMCERNGARFYHPSPILCTDNAAMIGSCAYFMYLRGEFASWNLNAEPGLRL